jgi:hypothetical protein
MGQKVLQIASVVCLFSTIGRLANKSSHFNPANKGIQPDTMGSVCA